jgi:hypothetical protein
MRLVKSLFERGLTAEDIRQLFRLIDWMLELPNELEHEFKAELHRFEEEKQMPYITSVERIAREEGFEKGREKGEIIGLQKGIEIALELKFGSEGLTLLPLIQSVQQIDVLRSVQEAIRTAESLDEIRQLVK